jgi:hypothetical protein
MTMTITHSPTPDDLAQPLPGERPLRRPFGIYAILVLLTLQLLAGAVALGLLILGAVNAPDQDWAALGPDDAWQVPVLVAEVILVVLLIVGLWRYQRWAWPLMMVLLAYWLITDAYEYFFATPRYFSMLLDVAIFFYLNQREVRVLFEPTARSLARRETAA